MISTLKNKYYSFILALVLLVPMSSVDAQSSLALSVTPTLFEMSAVPGQVWQSSVKVINSNPYPLEVHLTVANFAPQGEQGRGKFIPIFDTINEGTTLAEWVTVSSKAVTIEAEESREVPFVVMVPEDAAPGGHFAAILVGTEPPSQADNQMVLRTSQVVTSLFFLRIEGDVVENGTIRTFTTTDSISENPQATFELRFENKGNVHLQPQGSILIYNMWGSERGNIPINQKTHFGNVLPESIRQFTFTWEGERTWTDIGRYKAVASLAYGESGRQFTSQTTYFWVVPVKATVITLAILFSILLFIRWTIKAYVRRMLAMAGVQPGRRNNQVVRRMRDEHDVLITSYKDVGAPVRSGWQDFKVTLSQMAKPRDTLRLLSSFVLSYRIFFIAVLVLIGITALGMYYIGAVTKERSYEITINNPGEDVDLSSEELAFAELVPEANNIEQEYTLNLINTSGQPRTAAVVGAALSSEGYRIDDIATNQNRSDARSIIVFDLSLEAEALVLSQKLGGALISANTSTTSSPTITVYVGADQKSE